MNYAVYLIHLADGAVTASHRLATDYHEATVRETASKRMPPVDLQAARDEDVRRSDIYFDTVDAARQYCHRRVKDLIAKGYQFAQERKLENRGLSLMVTPSRGIPDDRFQDRPQPFRLNYGFPKDELLA